MVGFGAVDYAIRQTGKDVVLKRPQCNLDIELRAVKQRLNLRHLNLDEFYDIRNDQTDTSWVVMEYIGDDSLNDVNLRNPKGLSDSVMRDWFKGIVPGYFISTTTTSCIAT